MAESTANAVVRTKHCGKCGQDLPVAEFNKNRTTKDGLQHHCRECGKASSRDWHRKNAAHRAAYHQANRTSRSAYGAEYHAARREERIARQRERYAANIQAERERGRKYTTRKPGHSTARSLQRRALLRQVQHVPFTKIQLAQRLSVYGGKCWICGSPGVSVDHVKPVSRGGPHMLANLRPACESCNKAKNDTWPLTDALLERLRRANGPSSRKALK